MTTKVGTIAGRHSLPVDLYLVMRAVEPGEDAYTAAYEGAIMHAMDLEPASTVELYFTGLTEITLGALDGYAESGINVNLMRYDAATSSYVPLKTKAPAFRQCLFSPQGQKPHVYRSSDYHCPTCGAC